MSGDFYLMHEVFDSESVDELQMSLDEPLQ